MIKPLAFDQSRAKVNTLWAEAKNKKKKKQKKQKYSQKYKLY
jgi:hypothetical protein